MKSNSKILAYIIASGVLFGCASNKNVVLDSSKKTDQNLQIIATQVSDLIKADSAYDYHQIASRYYHNGNVNMAIIAFQKSLMLDQNYTRSLSGLAAIYANQKLYILAIPLLEKAVSVDPNAVNFNNLGYAYYLVKKYPEASRVLNQAIALDSGYLQARNNLSLLTNHLVDTQNLNAFEENKQPEKRQLDTGHLIQSAPSNPIVNAVGFTEVVQPSVNGNQLTKIAGNIYKLNLVNNSENSFPAVGSNPSQHTLPDVINSSGGKVVNDLKVERPNDIYGKKSVALSNLFDEKNGSFSEFKLSNTGKYLEVINSNGARGLAGAIANKLNDGGIAKIRIANARQFNLTKTYIEYRTGYRNDAVSLNRTLLNKPYLMRNDKMPAASAIRLLLGRDILINKNILSS